jgi:type II secretory pathway pseudopilin PulG
MGLPSVTAGLRLVTRDRNGFTFLAAIFMVMIIGIMLGLTGQSWKMIMKREREKELLFRGSQIKEAIENWYNPNYSANGVKWGASHPLMNLEDLLQNPYSLTPLRYLPQNYDTKLDDKNQKCAPDCPKIKLYQDPMTGKEWTIIRGTMAAGQPVAAAAGVQNAGIIGVASKSDAEPFKTDFKDTALENMGTTGIGTTPGTLDTIPPVSGFGTVSPPPGLGGKMTKYSEWKFVAESPQKNDHAKIYRAYHERW